ncbi:hypothetical protein ACIQPQ_19795 [Streptomyces sp. NPDC091281]|uniref:DUF6841 family protein n=1 Tax=Streptomyces sp. NPDC091281 TaxID=3365985 RepID=UPI003823A715
MAITDDNATTAAPSSPSGPGAVADPGGSVLDEVTAWFFDDYIPTWVGIGSGTSSDGPETILRYWGRPLHVASAVFNQWLLTPEEVIGFLELNHAPLREGGYTHTVVPDRQVTLYGRNAASVDVIWSRRRADESEIERWAVHFEVRRTQEGWRMVSIVGEETTKDALAEIWVR